MSDYLRRLLDLRRFVDFFAFFAFFAFFLRFAIQVTSSRGTVYVSDTALGKKIFFLVMLSTSSAYKELYHVCVNKIQKCQDVFLRSASRASARCAKFFSFLITSPIKRLNLLFELLAAVLVILEHIKAGASRR